MQLTQIRVKLLQVRCNDAVSRSAYVFVLVIRFYFSNSCEQKACRVMREFIIYLFFSFFFYIFSSQFIALVKNLGLVLLEKERKPKNIRTKNYNAKNTPENSTHIYTNYVKPTGGYQSLEPSHTQEVNNLSENDTLLNKQQSAT